MQVSDREWLAGRAETDVRLKQAEALVANNRGEDIAYRDFDIDGAPICARRCVALASTRLLSGPFNLTPWHCGEAFA